MIFKLLSRCFFLFQKGEGCEKCKIKRWKLGSIFEREMKNEIIKFTLKLVATFCQLSCFQKMAWFSRLIWILLSILENNHVSRFSSSLCWEFWLFSESCLKLDFSCDYLFFKKVGKINSIICSFNSRTYITMSTQDHVSRALEQWNFATANVLSCSFNREQPGMSC